ncbi:MAG: hypothetical protein IKY01_02580 [Prevotella sp.]|nr:hypothetical protein [Prevotella sp.]
MTTETEINLIQGLRKQNPKAQQLLLKRYGNDVFAQVVRLVPGLENAEEVYQGRKARWRPPSAIRIRKRCS